jgi:hypothetical protein
MINQGLTARLQRTWLSLLIEGNYAEVAALVVDSELTVQEDRYGGHTSFSIGLTSVAYPMVINDANIKKIILETLQAVATGRFYDQNGVLREPSEITVEYQIKLLDVEENWQEKVKEMIVNTKNSNQGVVTEKVFTREKKSVYLYNEMKFGSQAEIRIAQELEARKVLFFPLPLAIRQDTNVFWQDHKEPDFLICNDGVWGILEVSHHSSERYEKDVEKDAWFKQSGILCIEHRTADQCRRQPSEVVDGFLTILAKHKRQ